MAFNISYNFLASDKFTSIAKKVERSQDRVNRASSRGLRANIKLANSANRVASSFRRSGSSLGRFFGKLKSVNGLIAGVAGIGLLAGLKKVINVGSEFQDAFTGLQAITGITGKDLEKLISTSKKLALEFGRSPSKILNVLEDIASAKDELIGIDGALEKVARSALVLQKAAGGPLDDSVNTLLLSLNQFSAGADQADRFINVLAAGSKIGFSKVKQSSEAIREVGALAANTGISFERLNAFIQVLSKGGIKGSKAGVALRNVFLALNTTVAKLTPNLKTPIERLEKLGEVAAKLKSEGKVDELAELFEKLFGREGLSAAQILAGRVDVLKDFEKRLTRTIVAQEQASVTATRFSEKLKKLSVVIQLKVIDLFSKMEAKLILLINRFSDFLNTITPKGVENFANSLGELLEILGKVLKLMTEIGEISGFVFSKEAAAGFAAGATLGSVVPVIGTGIGGTLGFIGGAVLAASKADRPKTNLDTIIGVGSESNSILDVNINAPPGIIDTIKSKSKGLTKLNVGQNLRPANATQ